MKMFYKYLLGAFLFAGLCKSSYSCSCEQYTPEEYYCRSSFVAKFAIKQALNKPEDYDYYYDYGVFGYYRVKMLGKPWKFPENTTAVDTKRLYTPVSDGMCRLYLSSGGRYLISGRIYGGEMHVDMCSSMNEPTRLNKRIKRLKRFPPDC